MEALMPEQAIIDFADRVEHAVAAADRLAAERGRSGSTADLASTSQYQEVVRLKVILEVETSRTLAETGRVAAELEQRDLAKKLELMEVGR
jgi:hypothetical protein